ncbi:Do family serine endopeptidase [candidate division KSB1 bacterium]|nr:Do family serine endopeptidase [candidate division KSB1 bacterium]
MNLLFKKIIPALSPLKIHSLKHCLFVFVFSLFFIHQLAIAQNPITDLNRNQRIDRFEFASAETRLSFSEVAEKILPSVVSIFCTKVVKTNNNWNSQADELELHKFFSEKYFDFPIPNEVRQKGSGSGIIVTKDGYILTNLHVVENAEMILVKLANNRSFKATLKGADPLTELAVVKIAGDDLPAAKFGNSDSVKIGEWVLAIGNPLELRSTVTAGIVSAIGRDVDIIADNFGVENFIQTDATINPGSSGGALVNLKSEVIGINTAIATQSGFYEGYGFAIPANLAKQVMGDLIKIGHVTRCYLGISMQDVNERIARALGLEKPYGIFIDHVSEDGPAHKAGLREKDVLIRVNGKKVNQGNIIQSIIAQKKPGEKLLLSVIRKRRTIKIFVTLGERPFTEIKIAQPKTKKKYDNFGFKVKTINRSLANELRQEIRKGVLVLEVEQFSPAHEANIRANDIILEVDEKKITSQYAFEHILKNLKPGKVYILKLKRQNNIFHRFLETPSYK